MRRPGTTCVTTASPNDSGTLVCGRTFSASERYHAHSNISSKAQSGIELVIFPGESRRDDGTFMGTIYVLGANGEHYPMAGGPRKKHKDRGGHSAGPTPAGHYILDYAEHHTSGGWPASVIPWGAPLREAGKEVEYYADGHWIPATGPNGRVVAAARAFVARDHRKFSHAELDAAVRSEYLYTGPNNSLPKEYRLNDFGKWSWNLKKHGRRTVYYIHTTPANEDQQAARESGQAASLVLEQSHGCIHILPSDRDEMMRKGFLFHGRRVEIRSYREWKPVK